MNKDKIQEYIDKRMIILFDGKRLDLPRSFKRDIATEIERAIKTTYLWVEEDEKRN